MSDAQIERPVNGADRFNVAARVDVVVTGHRHSAESYAGDFKSSDRYVLHGDVTSFFERFRLHKA
ncbi:MAG: hypothetical protein ACJ8M1_12630 [Chthoniobacterales bacterium]